jgi:predicted NBD/HSP70 family sugar kinase
VGVGSGIGAGIVLDERAFLGRNGFSGEIGHCKVVGDDGPLCTCGARGCLETVASGGALERQAQEALDQGTPSELGQLGRSPTARDITRAALNGDELSRSLLEAAGGYLGKGIALMQNILNPEIVVLGGQLLEAEEVFLGAVRRAAAKHAMTVEQVPIVPSTLKEHAIITGAVLLAMDQAVRSYRIVETNSPIVVG